MSLFLLSLSPAKRGNQGHTSHPNPPPSSIFAPPNPGIDSIYRLLYSGISLPCSFSPALLILSSMEKLYPLAICKHSHPLGPTCLTHWEAMWGTLKCPPPSYRSFPALLCQSLALDMYFLAFYALAPASPA